MYIDVSLIVLWPLVDFRNFFSIRKRYGQTMHPYLFRVNKTFKRMAFMKINRRTMNFRRHFTIIAPVMVWAIYEYH